jgi:hypothetical protein
VNLVDNRQFRGRLVPATSSDPLKESLEESHIGLDADKVWSMETVELKPIMSAISQRASKPMLQTLGARTFAQEGVEGGSLPPVWWFEHFDTCWAPLRKWLGQKKVPTLNEFQLITNHVSGLTSIEKTIAVSAFVTYKNMQC